MYHAQLAAPRVRKKQRMRSVKRSRIRACKASVDVKDWRRCGASREASKGGGGWRAARWNIRCIAQDIYHKILELSRAFQ